MRYLVMVGLLAAPLLAKDDALTRTRALVEAFKAVKEADEGKPLGDADRQHNEKAFTTLDGFFDQEHLRAAPVAPHHDKLDEAQRKQFGELFWPILRLVAYPDSGSFLREAKYELKAKGATDVQLTGRLEKEDLDVDVVFHWKAGKDGTLRLADASFDGSSLVKDYQNQFGRILAKKGAAGLIAMLEKKLAEEQKKQGS